MSPRDVCRWSRFVAIGDSFTEGLDDPGPGDRPCGWADRLAGALTTTNPRLRYANLAIRGRKLPEIASEQLPAALTLKPDLLSFAAGGNDAMRPNWDASQICTLFEEVVRQARTAKIDVLLFAFGNTGDRVPAMRLIRSRLDYLRDVVFDVGRRYDCHVVDLAGNLQIQNDPQLWADDRIHFNPEGHDRIARAALEALGLGDDSWRQALPPRPKTSFLELAANDARWAYGFVTPWIGRRLRGTTSGGELEPKRPVLTPIEARSLGPT